MTAAVLPTLLPVTGPLGMPFTHCLLYTSMDINLNYSEDANPISLKSDFILGLCELIVGGRNGLMPIEKTVIDVYKRQCHMCGM